MNEMNDDYKKSFGAAIHVITGLLVGVALHLFTGWVFRRRAARNRE